MWGKEKVDQLPGSQAFPIEGKNLLCGERRFYWANLFYQAGFYESGGTISGVAYWVYGDV